MSKPTKSGDYEVGYGKPPKEHQFKPKHTKSKGKRARRRTPFNFALVLEDELTEATPFGQGGKWKKLPMIQVGLKQTKLKALAGDLKAMLFLMQLAKTYMPPVPEEDGEERELTPEELAVLSDVLAARELFLGGDPA